MATVPGESCGGRWVPGRDGPETPGVLDAHCLGLQPGVKEKIQRNPGYVSGQMEKWDRATVKRFQTNT